MSGLLNGAPAPGPVPVLITSCTESYHERGSPASPTDCLLIKKARREKHIIDLSVGYIAWARRYNWDDLVGQCENMFKRGACGKMCPLMSIQLVVLRPQPGQRLPTCWLCVRGWSLYWPCVMNCLKVVFKRRSDVWFVRGSGYMLYVAHGFITASSPLSLFLITPQTVYRLTIFNVFHITSWTHSGRITAEILYGFFSSKPIVLFECNRIILQFSSLTPNT